MTWDEIIQAHREHYASYHDHKEQMAYLVAIVYVSATTAAILQGPDLLKSGTPRCVLISMCSAAFLFGHAFVIWQLSNREFAANIVRACTAVLTRFHASGGATPDMSPTTYRGLELPRVLVDELGKPTTGSHLGGARTAGVITVLVMIMWSILAVCSIAS